jgi:hypothetical protein
MSLTGSPGIFYSKFPIPLIVNLRILYSESWGSLCRSSVPLTLNPVIPYAEVLAPLTVNPGILCAEVPVPFKGIPRYSVDVLYN